MIFLKKRQNKIFQKFLLNFKCQTSRLAIITLHVILVIRVRQIESSFSVCVKQNKLTPQNLAICKIKRNRHKFGNFLNCLSSIEAGFYEEVSNSAIWLKEVRQDLIIQLKALQCCKYIFRYQSTLQVKNVEKDQLVIKQKTETVVT